MSIGGMVPTSTRRLIVPERLVGEVERLLRDLQLTDRAKQIEVGAAHVARRLRQPLLQLKIHDLLLFLAGEQLLPKVIDRKVAQERLGVNRVEIGREARVEGAAGVARGVARAVDRELITAATPLQQLLESAVGAHASIGQRAAAAGEEILGRRRAAVLDERGDQVRGVIRARLVQDERLHLRAQALGADPEIVLERHANRFVGGQLESGLARFDLLAQLHERITGWRSRLACWRRRLSGHGWRLTGRRCWRLSRWRGSPLGGGRGRRLTGRRCWRLTGRRRRRLGGWRRRRLSESGHRKAGSEQAQGRGCHTGPTQIPLY